MASPIFGRSGAVSGVGHLGAWKSSSPSLEHCRIAVVELNPSTTPGSNALWRMSAIYVPRQRQAVWKWRHKVPETNGSEEIKTAFQIPWQNPFVERCFRSIRRELLDHAVFLDERHVKNPVSRYAAWYENHRLRQGLGGKRPRSKSDDSRNAEGGKIVSIPVMGGLSHRYKRVAV